MKHSLTFCVLFVLCTLFLQTTTVHALEPLVVITPANTAGGKQVTPLATVTPNPDNGAGSQKIDVSTIKVPLIGAEVTPGHSLTTPGVTKNDDGTLGLTSGQAVDQPDPILGGLTSTTGTQVLTPGVNNQQGTGLQSLEDNGLHPTEASPATAGTGTGPSSDSGSGSSAPLIEKSPENGAGSVTVTVPTFDVPVFGATVTPGHTVTTPGIVKNEDGTPGVTSGLFVDQPDPILGGVTSTTGTAVQTPGVNNQQGTGLNSLEEKGLKPTEAAAESPNLGSLSGSSSDSGSRRLSFRPLP